MEACLQYCLLNIMEGRIVNVARTSHLLGLTIAHLCQLEAVVTSPLTGAFQPYELLGKFIGSPVIGNWTLDVRGLIHQHMTLLQTILMTDACVITGLFSQVSTSPLSDSEGKLLDWTLDLSMQPCRLMDEGEMQWERVEVTGDEIPSPRVWHTAIALEESIFVIGGCRRLWDRNFSKAEQHVSIGHQDIIMGQASRGR